VSVVILLADGVRPDTLDAALSTDAVPALTRLRGEGGLHTITTCFPSVTGPAYAPFIMGRFPGPIGLPGLRWFDRSREVCHFPDYTRSYIGYQLGAINRDMTPDAPTMFELSASSVGALSMITRGLPKRARIGTITPRSAYRAARTHFSGNVAGWLQIDREISGDVVDRIRAQRPDFVFAALTGVDKVSHARGHGAPLLLDALQIVDATAAAIRDDAERDGRWDEMSLWIVSDHGHSRVKQHEDLARLVANAGYRTIAHPWVFAMDPEVAVMVSGNAMAHLYLDMSSRERVDAAAERWRPLVDLLLTRPAVDLCILTSPDADGARVTTAARGDAFIVTDGTRFQYRRESGDPLDVGCDLDGVCADAAYDATIDTDYPDGVVQIAHLAASARCGEIVLSAARDWDFRARYEPIPHVSSHGALHREHMLVPLLVNRPVAGRPRRTVDVMPSALAALGMSIPPGLDGRSFV
jgi:type I phosphodiesterase/nucleotide pyrophosphatase